MQRFFWRMLSMLSLWFMRDVCVGGWQTRAATVAKLLTVFSNFSKCTLSVSKVGLWNFSFPILYLLLQILELVKGMHYQLACQKYFELTHNVSAGLIWSGEELGPPVSETEASYSRLTNTGTAETHDCHLIHPLAGCHGHLIFLGLL